LAEFRRLRNEKSRQPEITLRPEVTKQELEPEAGR
jgi:hypothetical protein